ncbi:tRNA dihydrouridine(20/20a) synthase DusA [Solimonas fluminis]|uniref:tRNA-dihydrouridine(20/20a) synthase n=1 Tax=Solimonas fluminis TaxID=2086571 RepID=A0A2S5TCD2_9GAMM|nr:tRNA dihydrouridine(20/20a) synthase DusA [Solimonas fluminis]PPE72661.1 tRNA dihydrouridine(20/20a) synthase DusA [Solimonas fluminis]
MTEIERKFCVAPMMDWTDRHCRFFLRLMSRRAWLYTEMVTTGAIIHGDRERFLRFHPAEHPVALQLGGSEPDDLARCAEIGTAYGYDEINLNCGCPSDRVQEGRFGACLMKEPARVAEAVAAMRRATHLPVTVKTRIGVDESEDYVFLKDFIETVAAAGCTIFIVHARKAWLKGLSPKENREIPPLQYEVVHRLKREFPQLTIVLNGGLKTLDACVEQMQELDGVMLGREVYENPYLMTGVDSRIYGEAAVELTRPAVIEALLDYVDRELAAGAQLNHISRHILGLFRGQPGGRAFRRVISQNATRPGAGADVIRAALAEVEAAALRPAA